MFGLVGLRLILDGWLLLLIQAKQILDIGIYLEHKWLKTAKVLAETEELVVYGLQHWYLSEEDNISHVAVILAVVQYFTLV